MSVSLPPGEPGLQVRCAMCSTNYDFQQNRTATPYVAGTAAAPRHRIQYEVCCPECGKPEATWSLAAPPS